MTAAVMSNYYYAAANNWRPGANNGPSYQSWFVGAPMAQYGAPTQPNQPHYNQMYQAAAPGPPPLLDSQDQLQYGELNQVGYSRVEPSSNGLAVSGHQVHELAQQLQQHTGYDDHHLSQPLQPVPQAAMHAQAVNGAHTPHQPVQQDVPDQNQKVNRLRKACDSCSIRKVKCDESGPPCRACTALDIPCTFDRPSRRRGPPNRYAESIKRRRLEEPTDPTRSMRQTSPSSPTNAAQALAALSSGATTQHLSAESICPIQTIDLLIDDFFTYIHPLYPFPHEPTFREAWKRREDISNSAFLALLASMIGTLVASFPRKPRLDITAQRKETRIPDHLELVSRCQRICSMARGTGYLESDNLSVYHAATSYFQGRSWLYLHKFRPARLYFAECLSIIRTLGIHRDDEHMHLLVDKLPESLDFGSFTTDSSNQDPQVDNITQEMGRRIFWTLHTTIRSMQQISKEFREVHFPPSTPTERYPPLPTEVDDCYIHQTYYEQQPPQYLPIITGFNKNVNVFRSYDELASIETALGGLSAVDRQRQLMVLKDSLRRCKSCSDALPSELDFNTTASDYYISANGDAASAISYGQPRYLQDTTSSLVWPAYSANGVHRPEQRRWIQHAMQKSNIYASILSTRSYIVQKFWSLYEAHERLYPLKPSPSLSDGVIASGLEHLTSHEYSAEPEEIEQEMREESGDVVKDVLNAVGNIKGVNMEPNADNFTAKIRALAGKLLEMPDEQGDQDYHEPLSGYLQILQKLEQMNTGEANLDYSDDDSETREWAELHSCRLQLAELATSG